jgi:hypothetical protein
VQKYEFRQPHRFAEAGCLKVEAAYFVDASFWIALSSRRDQFHLRAIAWRQHVVRSQVAMVTTEAFLWE